MSASKDKILNDIARLASGTANVLNGINTNVRHDLRSRTDEIAERLNWVPRDDFERVESLLSEALKKQVALEKRIEALEKKQKK